MTRSPVRASSGREEVAAAPEDTRQRLLAVAAALFGEAGYHAVSLREIATAADANMALIGYHFGSKENLFKAAFQMDAEPVTSGRRHRIEQLTAHGVKPDLPAIIEAWIAPVFDHAAGQSRHAFMRLSGVIGDEKLPFLDALVRATHGPVNLLFLDALQACLPALSRDTLAARLSFLIGMLGAATKPLPASIADAGAAVRTIDLERRKAQFAAFAQAGFLAPEP